MIRCMVRLCEYNVQKNDPFGSFEVYTHSKNSVVYVIPIAPHPVR